MLVICFRGKIFKFWFTPPLKTYFPIVISNKFDIITNLQNTKKLNIVTYRIYQWYLPSLHCKECKGSYIHPLGWFSPHPSINGRCYAYYAISQPKLSTSHGFPRYGETIKLSKTHSSNIFPLYNYKMREKSQTNYLRCSNRKIWKCYLYYKHVKKYQYTSMRIRIKLRILIFKCKINWISHNDTKRLNL